MRRSKNSGRILVTGATGFIGVEVARQLAAAGASRRLMVHRPHRAMYVRDLASDLVPGNLDDVRSLERALRDVDVVVHLAGHATFESYGIVAPSLVGGTERLARIAAQAGVRRFVFSSSTLVYDGSGGPVDESTVPAPWTGYGRAKLEAEQALARIEGESGMQVTSIRLPHVYGSCDAMFAMARRGLVVSPGRGDRPFSHLHVSDAAAALLAAAQCDWHGESPIADDRPATWREFMRLLGAEFPRMRELRMPRRVAWLGAHAPALVARWRRRPTLLTPEAVAGWNRSLVVTPGTLWRQLDTSPNYPTIASGIAAAVRMHPPDGWVHSVDDHRRG
ncbi:MAG: NAD-dependent epimerase/dehydratase family protein [Gemmatimonadota bacterium]|nr:NAD-dependent epimerase/dehydratase family protein [Gemmatimonadota bacterium]